MSGAELRLLGPIELVAADTIPVDISGSKERRLLGVLAIYAGQVVSDDRLIDALWGDVAPRTASRTLHSYLSRLRKVLVEACPDREVVLESTSAGLVLRVAPGVLDVARVDHLAEEAKRVRAAGDHVGAVLLFAEALRAWRGRPLEEFADQPWACCEARRLEELRQVIVEQRLEAELACGRHAELVGQLEAICVAYPLRERPWALRMVALYRSGRQAEALRAYQQLRGILGEELGIEPSPALARLEQAILTHDTSLEWQPAGPSRPMLPDVVDPLSPSTVKPMTAHLPLPRALTSDTQQPFVGRRAEMAALDATWAHVGRGQRRAVFVTGEPGIGKSALVARLARQAWSQGASVLWGGCDRHTAGRFQPVVEALGHYVNATDSPDLLRQLGAYAAHLAALLPGLANRLDGWSTAPPVEPDGYLIVEAITALCASIAAQSPLMLVLEDLHWADNATIGLIGHLALRSGESPLLIVATFRDTDGGPGHRLTEALVDLRRAGLASSVALRGLSTDEVADLAGGGTAGQGPRPADRETARGLCAETGGNPLLLRELLRGCASGTFSGDGTRSPDLSLGQMGLTEGVKDAIGQRLILLSANSRTVMQAGSAMTGDLDLEVLELVTRLSVDHLLDALDEAVAASLLHEIPGGAGRWRFSHTLTRRVIYDGLGWARRTRLHETLGEANAKLTAGHGCSHPEMVLEPA